MLIGYFLTPQVVALGGVFVLAVLVFQVLVGMRKISFKGRTHMKVHKYGAYVLLGMAVLHGLGGLAWAFGWRLG